MGMHNHPRRLLCRDGKVKRAQALEVGVPLMFLKIRPVLQGTTSALVANF
jgi:hypothetical protein